MTRAETMVEGSGVFGVRLVPCDGRRGDGPPEVCSPAGGFETIGGGLTGGQVQAQVGTVPLDQADTAGGAAGGTDCSATGGLVSGEGISVGVTVVVAVAVAVAVVVMVGAVVGVSGGTAGTRLVGFKISALWTAELAEAVVVFGL